MGFNRRGFIMFVLGAAAGSVATPISFKLMDDVSIWSQNWPWIPRLDYGAEDTKTTVCKLCPAGCGLNITTVAGKPVTADGNPDHPMSMGGICPLGSTSVRHLYRPARVKGPMVKEGDGFKQISWDEAKKVLQDKLSKANGNVAMVSGDENGTATEVLAAFVQAMGSENYYTMPSEINSATSALRNIMLGDGQVGYDLENSDYVLMLGADTLTSWGTVVRNAKAFEQGKKKKAQYVYVGPYQNGTAAVSNHWTACAPGKEGIVAMGIAYFLLQEGVVPAGINGMEAFKSYVLNHFSPKKVEKETGVTSSELGRMARELIRARKPLVLIDSSFGQGMGAFQYAAGLSLNILLGRMNQDGGMRILPWAPQVIANGPSQAEIIGKDFTTYMDKVAKGVKKAPEVLMVYEANPVYAMPDTSKMAKVYEKVGTKVSFSSYMDETAQMSDLILPAPHYLERLDDSYTPYGAGMVTYSAAKPVQEPLFDTMSTPDLILGLAQSMGLGLGFGSFEEVVSAKAEALGTSLNSLAGGKAFVSKTVAPQTSLTLWNPSIRTGPARKAADPAYPLALAPIFKMNLGSRKMAVPPTALVTIQEYELQKKDFYVEMNKATAEKNGLKKGDKVTLVSPAGECKAKVNIFEGVMTDVVAAPLGFGHTAWDVYAKDKGDNVYKLLTVEPEPETGLMIYADTQVKLAKS